MEAMWKLDDDEPRGPGCDATAKEFEPLILPGRLREGEIQQGEQLFGINRLGEEPMRMERFRSE